MFSDATLQYAEEMTDVLLGVDGLVRIEGGEHDDGLIVLNMDPDRKPVAFDTFDAAHETLLDLQRRAAALPEADRRMYYDQLCTSTLTLLRRRQGEVPLAEQISGFLHVPPEPIADQELDRIKGEVHRTLTRMGYDGSLSEQVPAWEANNRVPTDEVAGTLQELMDEAWDRTVERMEIPAPKSDGMKVSTVSGVAFGAKCDYLNRTVELNIDSPKTRQGLKHLAVHECYPGHYVQFKLRETWYREGIAPADGLFSIVNSASSSPFEGIASNGVHVLDWGESDDDHVSHLMGRYRLGLAIGAAWHLHALKWSREATLAWLGERALTDGESLAANRLKFVEAPQRAALIWSYWWGTSSVQPVWERQPAERQPEFLKYLYSRMHSPQTVGMFDGGN